MHAMLQGCGRRPYLGQVGLAGPWRAIQQQPTPGLPFASEELRKLDWQNDCLLQSVLCSLQARNIIPLH